MVTNTFLAIGAVLAVAQCNAATFGAISLNVGGESRLYLPRELTLHDRVYFQYADKTGVTRCCINRLGNAFERKQANATALNALTDEPAFVYKLTQPVGAAGSVPFLGVAVIGTKMNVSQRLDNSIRVHSPTGRFAARACTSEEGLHVYGGTGANTISDLYIGFDYQVEFPTCQAAKTK